MRDKIRTLACRLAVAAAALPWTAAAAAAPKATDVRWLSTDYDFGTFNEADGEVTGEVKFVNTGSEPTFVARVRPSCGCTGASYTKSMIAPGDTAAIRFTYNPAGRPGRFEKTVKVWLGADNSLTTVTIRGTVVGEKQTVEWYYPVEAGALRLEKDRLDAGELKRGDVRHLFLTLYNQTPRPVVPGWKTDSGALRVSVAPDTVAAGDVGVMEFYLRSGDESRNGPVTHTVTLLPDTSEPDTEKDITLTAVVMPAVPALTGDVLAKAPLAQVVPARLDLGRSRGDRVPFEFTIENRGQGALHVERIYTRGAAAVAVSKSPKTIKPGKNAAVKGHLLTESLPSGPFRVAVEILTDDPVHPVVKADLSGIRE